MCVTVCVAGEGGREGRGSRHYLSLAFNDGVAVRGSTTEMVISSTGPTGTPFHRLCTTHITPYHTVLCVHFLHRHMLCALSSPGYLCPHPCTLCRYVCQSRTRHIAMWENRQLLQWPDDKTKLAYMCVCEGSDFIGEGPLIL